MSVKTKQARRGACQRVATLQTIKAVTQLQNEVLLYEHISASTLRRFNRKAQDRLSYLRGKNKKKKA